MLLWMLLVCTPPLRAQHRPPANHIDPSSLAAFADGFLPSEMARRHIPGAVLVVVSGDRVVAARGFGMADLESGRTVDADRTLFRVASVSKIVTTTAALQLVERGRLDLTKDVNAYLRSFQLAPYRGGPVTLHHLLTHTAGFDERLTGLLCRQSTERQPLASYLAQSMPPQFAIPGEVISYSNHGMSLVALLVEEASARRFEYYVRDEILEPLGMYRSGFLLTGDSAKDVATAYEFVDGHHRSQSPECLHTVGAGGFATTGTDMARFMIAHLQGGAYGGVRILSDDTIRRMHARQFAPHAGTSGWAYGFWEDVRNGIRGLMHDGGGKGYRALIYLLPEQQLGIFLAYNLADRHPDGELLEAFRRRFLNTYVPAPVGHEVLSEHTGTNFAGYYRYIRRARTTIEKMISIANNVHIAQTQNGTLVMTGASEKPVTLTAIGPMLFRRSDDRGIVAFDAVSANRPRQLILDGGGVRTYERISVFATPPVQATWLLSMALAFAYAGLGRPLFAIVRSMRRRDERSPRRGGSAWLNDSGPLRWSAWLAGIASALNLVFIIAFPVVLLGDLRGGFPEFIYGVPKLGLLLLLIPPVTSALAAATTIAVFSIWRDRRHRIATRLEHTVIYAALLSFIAFAVYWRLLGIQI
jgi:CubicO group peptidase (beta-lactamase class C family)